MTNDLSRSTIMQTLDWVYQKAVDGVPGFDSAQELADNYLAKDGDLIDNVNALIRWQNAKAGTSGFLTGLGGALTMPITIPASLASVMYVQTRMIAAIAHMGGYDLKDDRVKSLILACLVGNAAKDVLKEVGIVVGQKLTIQMIKGISGKTVTAINQRVGFRLLTKFGEKGAVNLGKAVPVVGGVIGGTIDLLATNIVGNVARDTFVKVTPNTSKAPGCQ